MTEFAKSSTNESSIADAFRSPPPGETSSEPNGVRLRIHPDQPLRTRRVLATGWAAFWAIFYPNATVIELSGRINVTLSIYPTFVQIEKRRWFGNSRVLAWYKVSIPVYDEIGDTVADQLRVTSELAFLYPFVPMHVRVELNDAVVFGQGRFDLNHSNR